MESVVIWAGEKRRAGKRAETAMEVLCHSRAEKYRAVKAKNGRRLFLLILRNRA